MKSLKLIKLLPIFLILGSASYASAQLRSAVNQISSNASECTTVPTTAMSVLNTAGMGTVSVTVSGTWTGTVSFRVSNNGVDWTDSKVTPPNSAVSITSTTANGNWSGPANYNFFCAAFLSAPTGTATVSILAITAGGASGASGDLSDVTTNTANTASATQDLLTAFQGFTTNQGVDARWLQTAPDGGPLIGGRYNTTFPTAATDTQAQPFAVSAYGEVFTYIRDGAGNHRSANVTANNELQTLATGTYAEDAPHTDADKGLLVFCRRIDTAASSSGTSGDYSTFNCGPNGGLWTSPVPANSTAVASAASTNSNNVKNAPGIVTGVILVNTTATLYYIRFYNTTSAPTCSSSTGYLFTLPIPASTSGAGGYPWPASGVNFDTGVSYCITGGASSTDNTNAATGIYGFIASK